MVPRTSAASQYPGIYLFTSVARLMRPVWNYSCKSVEMIGTFEQVYLNVAITDSEAKQLVSNALPVFLVFFMPRTGCRFVVHHDSFVDFGTM